MLGLLHRVKLGTAPRQLAALFPFQQNTLKRYPTRLATRRHPFQLEEPIFYTDIYRRSLFGLTVVYNLLPEAIVRTTTVKRFQHLLQSALKNAINQSIPNWNLIFSPISRPVDPFTFQRLC